MEKSTSPAFIAWLNEQMAKRGWSIRQTAKNAGISHSIISLTLNGEMPTYGTCAALASAFEFPPIEVFKLAGLLPQGSESNLLNDQILFLFDKLPLEDQQEILQIAQIKLERQRKNSTSSSHNGGAAAPSHA
jgi:transcriptional regulator with XRE-family HTH domain